jgi:hypothetical protein
MLFIVAVGLRALQRKHGSNIECHAAQVGGQSIEQVALPCVGRKFANEGAILGIDQQLFESCLQIFHGDTSRAPALHRTPLRRNVVRIVRTLDHAQQRSHF